jgi:hypothetical protein
MTQLERLNRRLPENDEATNQELLDAAKMAILNKRYPLHEFPVNDEGETYVEDRYLDLQIRIAVELDAKTGAEGETGHSENGITRTYERAGISPSLLNEITPKGRVL